MEKYKGPWPTLREARARANETWDTRPTKEEVSEDYAKKQKAFEQKRREGLEKAKD